MEPNKNLTAGPSCSSTAGGGRSWLGGWGWLALCALGIVGAILAFGGALGTTQDAGNWLPLFFVLPCAIMMFMMFMCMRHMGGNQGETGEAGGSSDKTGAPRAGTEDGR
jgi:hypothetical protein